MCHLHILVSELEVLIINQIQEYLRDFILTSKVCIRCTIVKDWQHEFFNMIETLY